MGVNSLPKTVTQLRFKPRPFCAWAQHANHLATKPPTWSHKNIITDCGNVWHRRYKLTCFLARINASRWRYWKQKNDRHLSRKCWLTTRCVYVFFFLFVRACRLNPAFDCIPESNKRWRLSFSHLRSPDDTTLYRIYYLRILILFIFCSTRSSLSIVTHAATISWLAR